MSARDPKEGSGILSRLKGLAAKVQADVPERRTSKRVELPIPVRLQIGQGEVVPRRLHDISQLGLRLDAAGAGAVGDAVTVHFDGYPEICGAFSLSGAVVRAGADGSQDLAIRIDRQTTPAEAMGQYRKLVLHYLRHRPLLDEVDKGFFEGQCESCGWIGRVGARSPRCSKCGQKVVPVRPG